MVDTDDAERRALATGWKVDGNCRLVERCGDVIDWDGVVGIGAVQMVSSSKIIGSGNHQDVCQTYVSALTSQMTLRRLLGEDNVSTVTK